MSIDDYKILDINRDKRHMGCQVFDAATGEEILCEYADEGREIVRGVAYTMMDGQPIFQIDPITLRVKRYSQHRKIRITKDPQILLCREPSTIIVVPLQDMKYYAESILGLGNYYDPMICPDDPEKFARNLQIKTTGTLEQSADFPFHARILIEFGNPLHCHPLVFTRPAFQLFSETFLWPPIPNAS